MQRDNIGSYLFESQHSSLQWPANKSIQHGGGYGLSWNAYDWSVAYYLANHWLLQVLTKAVDDIVLPRKCNLEGNRLNGILGGAGTYAVVGARLISPGIVSQQIGWVVHVGYDFPFSIRKEIESWNIHTRFVETPNRRTTRALNTYAGDLRGFEFLTPKIQVDHTMLGDELIDAQVFHIIGTPERCISIVEGIIAKRAERLPAKAYVRPLFVWEPMENSCSPENMPLFQEALKLIDTFSPNEDEFAKLFGVELDSNGELSQEFLWESCKALLLKCGFKALVVRLGARGALIAQNGKEKTTYRQLPAYHQRSKSGQPPSKIVDVTGGGNAFLGAYCVALKGEQRLSGYTIHESAAIFGSIAASFAIEQIGMPKLTRRDDGTELWNGLDVLERMNCYACKESYADIG